MSEPRRVKEEIVVSANPEMAFEAVTRASELREWCCDEAWTQVRPGGRYELRWNQGYRADGRFVEVDSPCRAVVSWKGSGEPGSTTLEFTVEAVEARSRVAVVHTGFGPEPEWDSAVAQSEKGWAMGLENLKSTLETGVDLRSARQPFLGISLDLLTPERAAKEGIAAEQGIYVLGTVEESGARAAGIKAGDALVALGGAETSGFQELGAALRAHQAGDEVALQLVRGQQRETLLVTLGQRPQTEVFATAAALAESLDARQREVNQELATALGEVSDEEAEHRPDDGGWSVKQILAHLSTGERGFHFVLANLAVNGWLDAGGYDPDALPGQLEAVLEVTPTLRGLEERFYLDEAETVALLRRLPELTVAHKSRFRRICENVAYSPDHTREHIEQIRATIRAARNG